MVSTAALQVEGSGFESRAARSLLSLRVRHVFAWVSSRYSSSLPHSFKDMCVRLDTLLPLPLTKALASELELVPGRCPVLLSN